MKKTGFIMTALGIAALAGWPFASANAQETTIEALSSDGTTTTIIVPTAPDSTTVVAPDANAGTEVIITPRPAVDAVTGDPASRTTKPAKVPDDEKSLRDRVRDHHVGKK